MKDFAGSSITYYGLAREKVMNRYPRLISVLVILALICVTGLAIFLISDLVSFASNPDQKGVPVGLDLKGSENGIGSIGANSSMALDNLSHQTKEPNFANLSQMNASLPSSQAAKGVIAASKSSSSNSPAKKHHSSSSSSSSSSSFAKSAKKSNDTNNLTQEGNLSKNEISTNAVAINETAKGQTPINLSLNNSQGKEPEIANATGSSIPEGHLSIDAAESLIGNSSNLSSQISNDSQVEPTAILASLPVAAIDGITNPAKDTVSIIQFKTQATTVSDTSAPSDSGGLESSPVVDNSNKAQSLKDAKKKPNSQAVRASSQKSKVIASSQTKKAEEARAKQKDNRNRITENMKKKAAQSRAKAAKNAK